MAFVVPIVAGLAGAAGGAALAGAALGGIGGLGATLAIGAAAGLGGALVSAAVTGGLDEMFDNPEQLLVSMGMGMLSAGVSNIKGAFDGLKNVDPASFGGKVLKGINSAVDVAGNVYDSFTDTLGTAFDTLTGPDGTLGELFSQAETLDYDSMLPDYGDELFAHAQADQLKTKFAADAITGDVGSLQTDPWATQYEGLAEQAGEWTEAMGTDQMRMLREQEIFGDFAQTTEGIEAIKAASPFTYEEELASGFLDESARLTGEALQQEVAFPGERKGLELPELPMAGGDIGSVSIPAAPKTVQTITGSMGAGSGTAGILTEDEFYNNPVVQPLRQAMQRQAQKASSLANRTWGLLQPTRQAGLMG